MTKLRPSYGSGSLMPDTYEMLSVLVHIELYCLSYVLTIFNLVLFCQVIQSIVLSSDMKAGSNTIFILKLPSSYQ